MSDSTERQAHLVADLTFGDAGKGTLTDWLARRHPVHTVIRYNGGAQAGHRVVTDGGRGHVFSQFGSATFVPGVRTYLSRHVIVNPLAMLEEARRLEHVGVLDAFARTAISAAALVATPFQRAANRLREVARSEGRHGSCGMGIGETRADSLLLGGSVVRVADLQRPETLRRKLRWLQAYKRDQLGDAVRYCRERKLAAEEVVYFEDGRIVDDYVERLAPFLGLAQIRDDGFLREILDRPGDVVFEGAQGVLLDEWRGFHPYTTWSDCTFGNATALLDEHGYGGAVRKLGVVRAYATRHGPGPFVTEDAALSVALPDSRNFMNDWQREFRVGWFDAVATRYAIAACGGIDALAVTCLDRLRDLPELQLCDAYALPEAGPDDSASFVWAGPKSDRFAADIRLGPARDLSHQEALTARLLRARPVYRRTTSAADQIVRSAQHLDEISASVGKPIIVASFGPRAADKQSY